MALVPRDNISVFDLVLVTLSILFLCYCMLRGRISRKGLLHLLGVRVVIPQSPSQTAAAWTRPLTLASATSPRDVVRNDQSRPGFSASPYHSSRTMLKRAVDANNAPPRSRKLNELFSSSPPAKPADSTVSVPGQRDVLGSSASVMRNGPSLTTANSGVKRTHSGLAKALSGHGSFEVAKSNSQQMPIVIDENSPIKLTAPKVTSCEYFDEDDFDDDLDLEFEDPSTKTSLYPTLPKTTAPAPQQTFCPTLPKQHAHVTSVAGTRDRDSGYGSIPPDTAVEEPVRSSAPLPWSSSPPTHLETPSLATNLKQYAYNNGPAPTRPQPKPTTSAAAASKPAVKRRTLPWMQEQKQMDENLIQADQNGPPSPPRRAMNAPMSREPFKPVVKRRLSDASTPMQPPKKSPYPWNSTASAIKDQQKIIREQNKKKTETKMKFNEASAEAIVKAKRAKSRATVARVFLSDEQQHVLDLVSESKKSVFFTGSAGTGKSVLLREIIATLRKKYLREPDRIAVTASTGLAACNIGGVTLHSFAGIGLGKEEVPELVKKIKRNQKAKHRWMRTKVLVVDEVSMVDGDLFDKLEAIARQIRNNGRPFGGIQLVITGDFFQLPPVPDYGKVAKFAFDAATWTTSIDHTIGLHHVFRQKDPIFAGMLNEMREGRLTPTSVRAFQALDRPMDFEDNLAATELFPTRNEVEKANASKMSQLVGDVRTFEARDGGTIVDKTQRDKLLSNCMAPETIQLKKGAQVMLIKNIDESLVNGSLGKVIGFMSETTFDAYHENDGEFSSTQGGTLADGADDLSKKQERARGRITENLLGSTTQTWPVVRFTISDGTTRDLLCQRELWKVELPDGEVQASRSQVPLILAWALSIHKAQGQTLERVKVDLGKVFEKGQAYVALSRATSMQGLQVLRFDVRKVNAHEKVRTFYSNLSRVENIEKGLPKADRGKVKPAQRGSGVTADEYERNFAEGRF